MATPYSILKNVVGLNQTHISSFEQVTLPVERYGETHYQDKIIVHARPVKHFQSRCPICMKKCVHNGFKQETESTWFAPAMNGIPVCIKYRPQRIQCEEHGALNEFIPWADGDSRFTKSFNDEVAWLATEMSKLAISEYLGINWRTVGNCITASHSRLEPDVSARIHTGLKMICVDETSIHKGHEYITVVYDMERNRTVWVHEKHGLSIFEEFCQQMTEKERAAIEVVAGDGAQWIDTCCELYFPNANRCIDPFHVATWANKALDDLRISIATKASRDYYKLLNEFTEAEEEAFRAEEELIKARMEAEAELASLPTRGRPSKRKRELQSFLQEVGEQASESGEAAATKAEKPRKGVLSAEHQAILDEMAEKNKVLRGAKYALGHNPENRRQSQDDAIRLIETEYPDLYKGFQFKESLRVILHMNDAEQATIALDKWIDEAKACGLKPFVKLAEKVERHKDGIINSVKYQANSSKSEACNTTIKALIKMGRGFRNYKNLESLIYLKCSDLVIPLNNRIQPSAEYLKKVRDAANARRKARQEARRMAKEQQKAS